MRGLIIMRKNYNMNQVTLEFSTSYVPNENNTACFINDLVESLEINDPYVFGRPREYDLSAMLKLVLFAYTRSVFSSRKIAQLAEESLPARWLTQEMMPSYRTIARFRISTDLENMMSLGLDALTDYLRQKHLIDDVIFIDGTKLLADANKFTFVWKKNTIRFDTMNRKALLDLISELDEVYRTQELPEGSELSLDMVDEIITRISIRLNELEEEVEATKTVSPNPSKQERRQLKSQSNKLGKRRSKLVDHQEQLSTYGSRNSYSRTDTDSTFMRVKDDHMMNGQLKPAYNLQIATSNQFILGYDIYQNPTDTRTLVPFLSKMKLDTMSNKTIVADAGYGSESNYRYLEDNLSQHTALIPYGTMLKEKSRKWKTDESKVMNWQYYDKEDYYIDPQGVRFNFHAYRKQTDKNEFVREFKEYQAEKFDENQQVIEAALTKTKRIRKIRVNPSWEYFKAKQNELLGDSTTGKIYGRRKIDVETVFGMMKASLGFTRYHVRGLSKVKKETSILIMALNMMKLAASSGKEALKKYKKSISTDILFRILSKSIFFSL